MQVKDADGILLVLNATAIQLYDTAVDLAVDRYLYTKFSTCMYSYATYVV